MPPRDWRIRVQDILEAIASVRSYTAGMTFEQFATDKRTVDAVIRNLEVIGEASRRLPAYVRNRHSDVPWAEMGALRNLLLHEYLGVDASILWSTIQNDLMALEEPLRAALAAVDQPTG